MRRAGGRRSPAASRCCTARSPKIVEGIIARKKFVYPLHQRAAAGEEDRPVQAATRISPGPSISTATRTMHDRSVCQDGVYDQAVAAIKLAKARGFRVNINCTLFNNAEPERVATFFDDVTAMGIDGITVSPGYAYERAPDQAAFPQPRSDQGAVPRHLPRAARAAELVVQPVEPVPRFPRRQPDLPLHALGQSDAQRISAGSGPAICSAKATPRPSRS